MPINTSKISMKLIDTRNNKEYAIMRKLSFENDFYAFSIKNINNWSDQDSCSKRIIYYGDVPIGFLAYNWRTSNGYIYDNFGRENTWGCVPCYERAKTSASVNYPSVWVELMLIDKKFQRLGIGKYVMNNLGSMFREEFGNHIKFIVFDIDMKKSNVNAIRQSNFYVLNGCRKLCFNNAGNLLLVKNANNISLLDINNTIYRKTQIIRESEYCESCILTECKEVEKVYSCPACETNYCESCSYSLIKSRETGELKCRECYEEEEEEETK